MGGEGYMGRREGALGASSLGEGTSSIEGWALFACTLRMPAVPRSFVT